MLGLKILHFFAGLIKVVAKTHCGASRKIRVNLIQLVIRILFEAAYGRLPLWNLNVRVRCLNHGVCDLGRISLRKPNKLLIVARFLLKRGNADSWRPLLLICELVSVYVWGLMIEVGHLGRVKGRAWYSVCLDGMP